MRIQTTCRPISREYTSVVDLVRRGKPPPYSRSSRWANWTEAGGIVWTFVWLHIVVLLVLFGLVAGSFAFGPHRGVPYEFSTHKLTSSDVRHLRMGGAISDSEGRVLIDPGTDRLVIATVHRSGRLATQLRPHSNRGVLSRRTLVILQLSRDATYASFVQALDTLHQEGFPTDTIWVSAPADAEPSN